MIIEAYLDLSPAITALSFSLITERPYWLNCFSIEDHYDAARYAYFAYKQSDQNFNVHTKILSLSDFDKHRFLVEEVLGPRCLYKGY